jgi:small subunit ribosomal protein S1
MTTYQEKLVGVTRDGRQALIAQMRAGAPVTIVRDLKNQYDVNAIDVKSQSGQSLGFIARERAVVLAPILDRLRSSVTGRVISILGGGSYNYGIIVEFTVVEPPATSITPAVTSVTSPILSTINSTSDTLKPTLKFVELFSNLLRFDPTMSRDAKRLRAYLHDLAVDEPKLWIRALVEACVSGIPQKLEIDEIPATARTKTGLTRALYDSHGLRPEIAEWVVEVWAKALEFRVRSLPQEPTYPWVIPFSDDSTSSRSSAVVNTENSVFVEQGIHDQVWDESSQNDRTIETSSGNLLWDDGIEAPNANRNAADLSNGDGSDARHVDAAPEKDREPESAADKQHSSMNSDKSQQKVVKTSFSPGVSQTEVVPEKIRSRASSANGISRRYEKDQLVSGLVISIAEREILIELDAFTEGIVKGRDIDALPKDVRAALRVGDEVYAYVVEPEDSNGNIVLSLNRVVAEKDWLYAEELLQKKEALETTIVGFNKGGVLIAVGRLRGFAPASQLSVAHQRMLGEDTLPPELRFQRLVGQKALIKVVEIDRDRNRLILSERAAAKEARTRLRHELLSLIESGQVLEGIVSSIKDFGAFVDLGGADGLLHLSEVSYTRIKHPGELLEEGQKVIVKVLSIDRDAGRIALSRKMLQTDPWLNLEGKLSAGQIVKAKVVKLSKKYGVFIQILEGAGLEGVISLSELTDGSCIHPSEVVAIDQELLLRVLHIDVNARRIDLSLRQVDDEKYSALSSIDGGYESTDSNS